MPPLPAMLNQRLSRGEAVRHVVLERPAEGEKRKIKLKALGR